MVSIVIWSALIILLYYTIVYVLAELARNYSLADVLWGFGFVTLAVALIFIRHNTVGFIAPAASFVTLYIMLWGLRLFHYLGKRNEKFGEDFRYTALRRKLGQWMPRLSAFARIFMVRALLMFVVALPIVMMHAYPTDTEVFQNLDARGQIGIAIGGGLFLAGYLLEVIADAQLWTFRRRLENRGRIMKTGLWRYSRHPNYLGEIILWWGIFITAYTNTQSIGLIAVLSPLLVTVRLLFVSGIPAVERRLNDSKEYRAYRKNTSVLIPWPPKKNR